MRGHTDCSPQSYRKNKACHRPHLLTLPLCVYSPVPSYNKINSFVRIVLESVSAKATGMLAKFKSRPIPHCYLGPCTIFAGLQQPTGIINNVRKESSQSISIPCEPDCPKSRKWPPKLIATCKDNLDLTYILALWSRCINYVQHLYHKHFWFHFGNSGLLETLSHDDGGGSVNSAGVMSEEGKSGQAIHSDSRKQPTAGQNIRKKLKI